MIYTINGDAQHQKLYNIIESHTVYNTVQRLTLIFRSRRQIHWIWLIDPHPSSYLVLWDIISKTLFTYLEYEYICKIGDIGKAWMSPCQKLHIFLDSVNVDVNEFEIYRPYLQIEYDVWKDTDGFHIF